LAGSQPLQLTGSGPTRQANKGTTLGATRGFQFNVENIVGPHEYIKSRSVFWANGPLCALWATSKFVWKNNNFVEFLMFFNIILLFF
jgi:hypothetical protein